MRAFTTIIYKPFGIVAGILAGIFSKKLFDFVWSRIDEEEPPVANTEQATWGKLLTAAALQGVVFRVVRTAVDRYAAQAFRHLTGIWPGERRPDRA